MQQFNDSKNMQKKKNKERLITEARNSNIKRNDLMRNNKITKSRKQKWKEKEMYEYFKRQTKEIAYRDDVDMAQKKTPEEGY